MVQPKKKILFILHLPPPVHGSSMVGKFIQNSQNINQTFNSHYINLSTSATIDEIGKGGVKKIYRYLKIIKNTFTELLNFKPDLCYLAIAAKGGAFYKDAIVAILIKSLGFKIIYHFHNKGVKLNQEKKLDNFLYSIVFKNSQVILLSKHLYQDIQKYVPAKNVNYCPNGIPDIKIKGEFQRYFEKTEILFLSNLIETKGVFVLLEALAILNTKNIDFHCTYAGGEGDVTMKQFNNKLQILNLQEKVELVGKKYGSDKYELFSRANIFAFPTFYHNETFGLVNLEAMQFSLPIISTDEGGIPDVIDDEKTGFLVPQKDALALAEKLELLIRNEDLREKMGKDGRKRYEERFTLPIFEERLNGILKKHCE